MKRIEASEVDTSSNPAAIREGYIVWPKWLTRRFVVLLVVLGLPSAGFPLILLHAAIDQAVRNWVDHKTQEQELYRSIGIKREEYQNLPLLWRKTLAEVIHRDIGDRQGIKRLVERLDTRDLDIIGEAAKYAVDAGRYMIFTDHAEDLDGKDVIHLEELGIVDTRIGVGKWFDEGTTLWGHGVALVSGLDHGAERPFEKSIWLTEVGAALIQTLKAPTDLVYLNKIATSIEEQEPANPKFPEILGSNRGQVIEPDRKTPAQEAIYVPM